MPGANDSAGMLRLENVYRTVMQRAVQDFVLRRRTCQLSCLPTAAVQPAVQSAFIYESLHIGVGSDTCRNMCHLARLVRSALALPGQVAPSRNFRV
jgi:hypothetical protein